MMMYRILFAVIFLLNINNSVVAQNWTLDQSRNDLELSDLEFLNSQEGLIFGDSSISGAFIAGVILKTTDGGQTWNTYTLTNPNYRILSAHYYSTNEVFAAGRNGGGNNGLFLKSTDGGITWGSDAFFNERLFGVYFKDSNTGWVMGKNGLLSKTTDGGSTWTAQNITSEDVFSIKFFNQNVGIMSCSGGEVYRTGDGGTTWASVNSNASADLTAIEIDGINAWICGEGGTLIHSNDQGISWTAQTLPLPLDMTVISFADLNNGWAAGIAGTMYRTSDSGTIWQTSNSGSALEISGLAIPDINHGWYCNVEGEIYSFNTATSVDEIDQNIQYTIFPNPAGDYLTLNASDRLTGVQVILADINSKAIETFQVENSTDLQLDISGLPSGAYHLILQDATTPAKNSVLRFIKY